MANKYYLNEVGLARLLDDLSLALANHTTSEIEFEEVVDPETGETVKQLVNPNNFISAQSIVDYLGELIGKNSLSVSQDIATSTSDGYNITTNEIEYNGEESKSLNLALVTSEDIDALFTPTLPPELVEEH